MRKNWWKVLAALGGTLAVATGIAVLRPTRKPPGKPAGPVAGIAVLNAAVPTSFALDTMVTDGAWTLPADDGKGPLDSLTANVTNLSASGVLHKKLAATATSVQFRQPIPPADATWTTTLQICTWRGSKMACADVTSAPLVYSVTGPQAVIGLTVQNTKVP